MDEEEIQPAPIGLSKEECNLVRETWNYLTSTYGMRKFGIILFRQLFKISPEIVYLFPFKDLKNMY